MMRLASMLVGALVEHMFVAYNDEAVGSSPATPTIAADLRVAGQHTNTESRLTWSDPIGIVWGVLLPAVQAVLGLAGIILCPARRIHGGSGRGIKQTSCYR